MSPEFLIGGRIVVVDVYYAGKDTTIIPRVRMGESVAKELQYALGGRIWVNFDPSADFVPVRFETGTIELEEETLGKIEAFLRANNSRWFMPRG